MTSGGWRNVEGLTAGEMYNLGRGKLKKTVVFRGARVIAQTYKQPARTVLHFTSHEDGEFTRTLLATQAGHWIALEISELTKEQRAKIAFDVLKRV